MFNFKKKHTENGGKLKTNLEQEVARLEEIIKEKNLEILKIKEEEAEARAVSYLDSLYGNIHYRLLPTGYINSVYHVKGDWIRKNITATLNTSTLCHLRDVLSKTGEKMIYRFALICDGYFIKPSGISLVLKDPYNTITTTPSKKISLDAAESYKDRLILCMMEVDVTAINTSIYKITKVKRTNYTLTTECIDGHETEFQISKGSQWVYQNSKDILGKENCLAFLDKASEHFSNKNSIDRPHSYQLDQSNPSKIRDYENYIFESEYEIDQAPGIFFIKKYHGTAVFCKKFNDWQKNKIKTYMDESYMLVCWGDVLYYCDLNGYMESILTTYFNDPYWIYGLEPMDNPHKKAIICIDYLLFLYKIANGEYSHNPLSTLLSIKSNNIFFLLR